MDRFKFRIWDEKLNNYSIAKNYINCLSGKIEQLKLPDGMLSADNRFSVEQCTGLKDKNGKVIYEGDIFKAEVINSFEGDPYLDKIIIGQVSYYVKECCFAFSRYMPINLFDIEIIGNIHKNKELLEVINEKNS